MIKCKKILLVTVMAVYFLLMMLVTMSKERGKMMVEFFTSETEFNICYKLRFIMLLKTNYLYISQLAAGDSEIFSKASLNPRLLQQQYPEDRFFFICSHGFLWGLF